MNELSLMQTKSLKGLAIIMVVISHVGPVFGVSFVNILGPIGVALFLYLSGYGLEKSYEKNKLEHFLSKKIVKIYIPYLISVLLFTAWEFCVKNKISIFTICKYFLLFELPQGSYWFLIFLFYFYFSFYFVCRIENKYIQLIALLVSSFILIIYKGFNRGYLWQFASFPAGVFCARLPKIHQHKNWWMGIILLGVIGMSACLKKMPLIESNQLGIFDTVLQIIIIYSSCSFIIIFHQMFDSAFFMRIGEYSYAIYLAHCIALDWLKGGATIKHLLIYTILTVLFTLVVSTYISYIGKKQKVTKI